MASACWTCRLRRKKCDRVRPVCTTCAKLGIGCEYSHIRPKWMDGAERQSEKAKAIACQIREVAAATQTKSFAVQVFPVHEHASSQRVRETPVQPSQSQLSGSQIAASSAPRKGHSNLDETDNFLTTLYLDTLFGCLFPWYRPHMLSGGRSWLSAVLQTNEAVRHAVLSLSSHYFTLVLAREAPHTVRSPCEQHVWDVMAKHMDLSVRLTRQSLEDIDIRCMRKDVFHRVRILDSIAHLLIFEASISKSQNGYTHCEAGLTLLEHTLQLYGMSNGRYHLDSILLAMQEPSIFDNTRLGFRVWSASQNSFQFTLAVLLYADIIFSVSLRRAPRLQSCHSLLISGGIILPAQSEQLIHMEQYFGCHGWVLILIGEIAALDGRKRTAVLDGNSSTLEELAILGQELEDKLLRSLENLGPVTELPKLDDKTNQAEQQSLVTKAWLHAAWIYLSTVMYGWQPNRPTVCVNVQSVLSISEILTSQLGLRCPIWPLCVAGCMAMEDEQQEFRRLTSKLPPLQSFGANKEVLNVMERGWKHRDRLSQESWSLSDYLGAQGLCLLI